MTHITPGQAKNISVSGGYLVDIRSFRAYDSGHASHSISVEYSRKSFPERLWQAIPRGTKIVFIADDFAKVESISSQMRASGDMALVTGYLRFDEWRDAQLPVGTLTEAGTEEMKSLIDGGAPLLDIREEIEWEFLGIIPGAIRIPLPQLRQHIPELSALIQPSFQVVILCSAGLRSATAAGILREFGYTDLIHSPEGLNGWIRAGYPLQKLAES